MYAYAVKREINSNHNSKRNNSPPGIRNKNSLKKQKDQTNQISYKKIKEKAKHEY